MAHRDTELSQPENRSNLEKQLELKLSRIIPEPFIYSVTYSGHLEGLYIGLDTQTLASKRHFSSFLFLVVFQQKIRRSSNQ